MANLLIEDVCTFDNALPWMRAIVDAVEQNQVRVRVILENANSNGLENRAAIQVLTDELKNVGWRILLKFDFLTVGCTQKLH